MTIKELTFIIGKLYCNLSNEQLQELHDSNEYYDWYSIAIALLDYKTESRKVGKSMKSSIYWSTKLSNYTDNEKWFIHVVRKTINHRLKHCFSLRNYNWDGCIVLLDLYLRTDLGFIPETDPYADLPSL